MAQVASYPRDSGSYDGLGYVYSLLGKHGPAIDMFRESIRLDPDSPDTYGLLANSELALQQMDQARATIQQAHSRNVNGLLLQAAHYELAFVDSDASAMAEAESWMQNQPQYQNFGYALLADSAAYVGHLQEARRLTTMAIDSAMAADSKETAAIWYENAALREGVFGNPNEAKVAAERGVNLEPASLGARVEAALAYGVAGENRRVQSELGYLSKHYSSDTQVQFLWLPAIRAQADLDRNQPSSAIEDLQPSASIEFGEYPFNNYGSCLYTTYLRGNAYMMLRQGKLAAGEFQKILDHPGLVENCLTGALARLGLARANSLEARTLQGKDAEAALSRSLSAYRDFFALWKDADGGIPLIQQAKKEYNKLNGQTPQRQ
jgi:tetratricopeptide (TPR) repeat protein